jgi:small redox-active disulfide protein 2
MDIKVLGTGCAKCNTLERITKEAIEELKLEASVEKIEDIQKIMEYGVMFTPALVVDGEVLVKGSVPNLKKMKKILTQ